MSNWRRILAPNLLITSTNAWWKNATKNLKNQIICVTTTKVTQKQNLIDVYFHLAIIIVISRKISSVMLKKMHHQQSKNVKKYIFINKEYLDKEGKRLGFSKVFKVDDGISDDDDDSDATIILPSLPPFDTIIQTSTGRLICPMSDCDQQLKKMSALKDHFRVHCGKDYRPYRCIYPDDQKCGYALRRMRTVIAHIRVKHFHLPPSIIK